NLQAGIETFPTDNLVFSLDGGYSQKDIEADFPSYAFPPFSPPVYYDYRIETYTLSPKITFLAPLAGMNNELTAGVDLTKEKLNTEKFNDKARTLLSTDTDITRETVGGYITDTLSLTDRLLLNAGVRIEENRTDAVHTGGLSPYSVKDSVTEEAWQTSLTWLPTGQLKLFAAIDRTYRYPFVDEQAIYTGWGDAFNKDLDPETGMNYEIGAEYMPSSNLVLQATLFRTDMKNEIAWDRGTSRNINLDETTHRGLEIAASYTQDLFALHAYYTWLQSEFTKGTNPGNEIPWVPQNQLDINLDLFLTDALTFTTHMSYIGSMFQSGDNANTGANRQSEYALIDLLLQYDLPTEQIDATLFAGINNLFATEYNYLVSWGGYYPAPERTYKAGVSITF
ncbi:MAG TPA: TonB-dependent receptor, partial [Tichowtungia sp.]|nr:TonB-dependent receptor [Tichowtungia sp.]